MKRVTKNNLLKLVDMKKQYIEEGKQNKELLKEINNYIDNVINKDNSYYKKLKSYNFNNDVLSWLM